MGKLSFNILATFAEFEADLIRMRTREGMAITRDKGKLRGKQPKLTDRQQRELCRMHATGEYSISEIAEISQSPDQPSIALSQASFPLAYDSVRYRNRPRPGMPQTAGFPSTLNSYRGRRSVPCQVV